MVLYYTGTGNSEYVAKRIGEGIGDEVMNLFDRIRTKEYSEIRSSKPYVIVYPTYAWQMPRILEDYLHNTVLSGQKKVYFAATCGAGIGNMAKYLKLFCEKKELEFMGCAEIIMPENYIAMFNVPEKQKAINIIKKADTKITNVIECIKREAPFSDEKVNVFAKISSGFVNRLFYPMFVSAKKFYATDACIGCGKCERVCPLGNIRLKEGKPEWGEVCTHCMACICKCPKEAIEYGNKSKGKPRYQCPF